MASFFIIVALVVVVFGVPALLVRRPWRRVGGSVNSHGATMAVLASMAERSKDGVVPPVEALESQDPESQDPAEGAHLFGRGAESGLVAGRQVPAPRPAVLASRLPLADTGIVWIGPVSAPPPPAGSLSGGATSPPRLAPIGPTGPSSPLVPRPLAPTGFARPRSSSGRRYKTLGAVAAGLAVIGLGVGFGVGFGLSGSPSVSVHSPHASLAAKSPGSQTSVPSTPPSAATQTTVTQLSTGSGSATYQVSSSKLTLALMVTGPCWVEAKPSATSFTTLYQGVLQAGVAKTLKARGSIWVRLGDPGNVQVSLDGAAVHLPVSGATPFNLSFASAIA